MKGYFCKLQFLKKDTLILFHHFVQEAKHLGIALPGYLISLTSGTKWRNGEHLNVKGLFHRKVSLLKSRSQI